MRQLAIAVAMLFWIGSSPAQTATGRSNTGAISLTAPVVEDNAPKKSRLLGIEMEFSEPSGNKHLDAKETGRLRLVISNIGKATVRGVVIVPIRFSQLRHSSPVSERTSPPASFTTGVAALTSLSASARAPGGTTPVRYASGSRCSAGRSGTLRRGHASSIGSIWTATVSSPVRTSPRRKSSAAW